MSEANKVVGSDGFIRRDVTAVTSRGIRPCNTRIVMSARLDTRRAMPYNTGTPASAVRAMPYR